MFVKWIYLISSIILTIFFLCLSWWEDTLLPLIPISLIVWDTYRALKPIPFVVDTDINGMYPSMIQTQQQPLQHRREEVNLFTDFISKEEFKV